VIDNSIIQQFIDGANNSIALMTQPDKIHFHFSIMELEAWWLCMYTLFSKIDKRLTVDFMTDKLGDDLSIIDAEKAFFHPASKVSQLLNFVGRNYEKHFSEVESITSHIAFDDIVEVIMSDDKRCESFKMFCDNLISY